MALTPSISGSQSIAYPNLVTFTDTSTGTDLTITNRKIYVTDADGTELADGIDWSYANASTQLDLLTQSTSPAVRVDWLAGSTVVYTYSTTFCFNLYDYVFALGLLSDLTGAPQTLQDANYYSNFMQFIVNLFNSESAITYAGDIYSSQNALNLNQNLINNEAFYF
jgi:hypothetical protein